MVHASLQYLLYESSVRVWAVLSFSSHKGAGWLLKIKQKLRMLLMSWMLCRLCSASFFSPFLEGMLSGMWITSPGESLLFGRYLVWVCASKNRRFFNIGGPCLHSSEFGAFSGFVWVFEIKSAGF